MSYLQSNPSIGRFDDLSRSGLPTQPLTSSRSISRSGNSSNPPHASGPSGDQIEPLGADALPYWESLWLFHEIASEVQQGRSLRQVCESFAARVQAGKFPGQLSWDFSAVRRCCKEMKRFFGRRFGEKDGAVLFVWRGKGMPFIGLTESGRIAWVLTQDFLDRLGILKNSV